MENVDQLQLNFSTDSLLLLNICLAIIMFGIALDIKLEDFKNVWKYPKMAIVGLLSQFILLPFFTYLLVISLKPEPSIALGMMLVAACPGGNISNFLSHVSGSNSALSISLTAVATVLSLVFTPLNLELYSSLYEPTDNLMRQISLSPADVISTILIIIAIPLLAGILVQYKLPKVAAKLAPPLKILSVLIFLGFIGVALANNFNLFLNYIDRVLILVLIHNACAYLIGYYFARLNRLSARNSRTLAIETGIQNSGMALVIIFTFFNGLGGMALVAAWWGIWHIISGLSLAFYWNRRPLLAEELS